MNDNPSERRFLSRDEILARRGDVPHEDVMVPEWGGTVRVRGMTGIERDEFEASIVTGRGRTRDVNMRNIRAKLVSLCVVDPTSGERLFSKADVDALGQLSAAALDRVADVARRLSGLTAEDEERLAGNSGSDQSDGSGSDWPS